MAADQGGLPVVLMVAGGALLLYAVQRGSDGKDGKDGDDSGPREPVFSVIGGPEFVLSQR